MSQQLTQFSIFTAIVLLKQQRVCYLPRLSEFIEIDRLPDDPVLFFDECLLVEVSF